MPTPHPHALNRIELQVDLNYEVAAPGADFVFNVHAAHTPCQSLSAERLLLTPAVVSRTHTDSATGNRYLRLHATPGTLQLTYAVTVDLMHRRSDPAQLEEVPIDRLPPEVLGYLYPSRYCQSDRLLTLASHEFGRLKPGYGRVQAIRDWVHGHATFTSHSTNSNTSALDTLIDRVGVCRDFAHLAIAFCRCMNIPARYCTGYLGDMGTEPPYGTMDFAGWFEAYLGDRWYTFDARNNTPRIGRVLIARGRDACDVALSSTFGPNTLQHFRVWAEEVAVA